MVRRRQKCLGQDMTNDQCLKIFGVPDMVDFAECIKESMTYKDSGGKGLIASMLSDAQEEIEICPEACRRTLNRIKFLLSYKDFM